MKKQILILFICITNITVGLADEGMWLPMLVKRLNSEDIAKRGCKLTADEIYSVNNSSLKDAIVSLGFCTGELVSDKGLFLTNHHCAYDAIQENSTVEHNYLDNGFWAKNFGEELPIAGQTASILQRMDDVTQTVLNAVSDTMSAKNRDKAIKDAIKKITEEAGEKGKYNAIVRDMFAGNEYYLFVYEVFKDVRLVGAPPQSIGKFGGDTDNWMWPRHTGDFSFMRIYMSPDGKPAAYSTNNVPYKPKHSLPISIKGYKEGDYAMVYGFPGRTNRFVTAAAINNSMETLNPLYIKLFGKTLETWKKDMDADVATRIAYSSKYASTANTWKYFIGQSQGLTKLKVYDQKLKDEADFQKWVDADAERSKRYGKVLPTMRSIIESNKAITVEQLYLALGAMKCEAAGMSNTLSALIGLKSKSAIDSTVKVLTPKVDEFFRDFKTETDKHVFYEMLLMYVSNVAPEKYPVAIADFMKGSKSKEEKVKKFVDNVFAKSIFVTKERVLEFMKAPNEKKFNKDPLHLYIKGVQSHLMSIMAPMMANNTKFESEKRLYLEALRKYDTKKIFYPDANSTLRLTYGNVLSYDPMDAAHYDFKTDLDGIVEKYNPKEEEFNAPKKLLELIASKDYGRYAENGTVPVAFITNNDITGGNSGSPVINGNGELIGVAFDGNWEAMSGDLVFDQKLKRTICVDARYVLFIVDKYAGAQNLIDEMKINN